MIEIIVSGLAIVGTIMLTGAQMKLYSINKELKWQSEEMRTQTRLLAEIANSSVPRVTKESQT